MNSIDDKNKVGKVVDNMRLLADGNRIPILGTGPFWCHLPPYKYTSGVLSIPYRAYRRFYFNKKYIQDYVDSVSHSFNIGYRLLDFSASYGDGALIKKAIDESEISRNDLYITTRVTVQDIMQHKVRESVERQLRNFGTDNFDLLMFHWPVPGYFTDAWTEMLKLQEEGLCKSLGVANCHQHHIEALEAESGVLPVINQFEVHPLFTQKPLVEYCKSKNIVVEAYTPIARNDARLFTRSSLIKIAEKYGKTPVQIVMRWHIDKGLIPIVRSHHPVRQQQNLDVLDFALTTEEIKEIDGYNINSRLRYDPDNCDWSVM